jgi:acetyl esterase/lipase
VSFKLRDEGFSPLPRTQLLIYPALQATDLLCPGMREDADPLLSRHIMTDFWML